MKHQVKSFTYLIDRVSEILTKEVIKLQYKI